MTLQFIGPIISFWVYNRRTIVLNDHKTVRELLERRANIYSDRPKSWMYHELCNRGKSVFNISSLDSRHGKYRRLLRNELSGRAIREYHSLLEDQADVFVQSLTNEPQAFQQHLRRCGTLTVHLHPALIPAQKRSCSYYESSLWLYNCRESRSLCWCGGRGSQDLWMGPGSRSLDRRLLSRW